MNDLNIVIPVTVYRDSLDNRELKSILESAAYEAVQLINDRLDGIAAAAVDGATIEEEEEK